jgi:hypothetical protein
VKLPWAEQAPSAPLAVSEHDGFVRDALRRVTPGSGAKPSTYEYTTYLSSEIQATLALVEDLILCDHADVLYNREELTDAAAVNGP